MMTDAYLQNGKKDLKAVFDVFFRVIPNNGGYAVMAGLDKVIDYIKNISFTDDDLKYLESLGLSKEFIEYRPISILPATFTRYLTVLRFFRMSL